MQIVFLQSVHCLFHAVYVTGSNIRMKDSWGAYDAPSHPYSLLGRGYPSPLPLLDAFGILFLAPWLTAPVWIMKSWRLM